MPRKKSVPVLDQEKEEKRLYLESDLEAFILHVHPRRVLGLVHRKAIRFICNDEVSHKLLLLPRDHMKSYLAAMWIAWMITKSPELRILLISSTSNLATKQLKLIKDVLTSDNYRMIWPEMVDKDEAKREKWTEREISVDHPKRKEWNVRDPSIFTAGLTTNVVGLHCDISVLDDVVVEANAYLELGREKVENQYSLLSSVETTNAKELVVGTRYHPKDLYNRLIEIQIEQYDELGRVCDSKPLFTTMQEQVESVGDGTGQFLWPRQQGAEGKWFGFDKAVLALKRAQYLNKVHFRAQYYNDPHDVDSAPIKRDQFQYYNQDYLSRRDGRWFFKGERINVFAAVDFAYSLGKRSDFSSIVVVGCDGQMNYYVLDIDRFKTDKMSEYYSHILKLYEKWNFRKIRAEVSVAQAVIVKDLKDNYIRPNGITLTVDEFRPSRFQGSKEERILSVLEPRYANRQIWHYAGGNCQSLEEELVFTNPPHDDIKDALASCVDFCIPPIDLFNMHKVKEPVYEAHARFGGIL